MKKNSTTTGILSFVLSVSLSYQVKCAPRNPNLFSIAEDKLLVHGLPRERNGCSDNDNGIRSADAEYSRLIHK